MPDIKEVLKEYVETANNPQYNNDWNVINSKFPELKGYDVEVLKEYVETANNSSYNNDWNVINSKFPELFTVKKKSKSVASSTPAQSASKPSGQSLRNDMPVFTGFTNDQLNKIEESAKSTTYMGKVTKMPEKKNTWVSNAPVVQETKQAIVSSNPNVNNELKAKQMMEYTSLALFNNTNTFGLKEPNRADYKTDVDYANAVESYKAEIQKQRDAALTKLADEHIAENNLPEEQKKAVVETYWANKRVSDINQNLIKTGEIDKQIESLKRERASLEARYKEIGFGGATNPALDAESTRIAERMNSIDSTIKDLNSEAIKHQSLASREYAKNYVYSLSLEEARREIEKKPNKTELDITKLGEINTALSVYESINRTYEGVFSAPQQNQEYAESVLEKSGAVAGSFNERVGEIASSAASLAALGDLAITRLLATEDFANRLESESASRRYDEALSQIISFDVESLHEDDYKTAWQETAENIREPFKYLGKPINPNDIGWNVASGLASMVPDIATVGMLTKSANAVKGVSTLEELAAAVKPSSQMNMFVKYSGVLESANTIYDEMEKGNMSPLSIANKSMTKGGEAALSMLAMGEVMGKTSKLAEGAENAYLTNLSKKYGTELIMNSKGSIIKAKAIGVGVKLATEPAAMVAVSAPFELVTTGDISTNNAAHNFGTGLAFSLMGLPSIGRAMFSSATHTTYVAEPKLIKETLKAIREKKLTTDELLNLEAELLTKADEFNTLGQTYKAKPLIDAAQVLQNIRNIKVMGDTYIAEPKVVEDVLTVQKHPSVEIGAQQQEKLKIFEEHKKEVEKRDKEISSAQDRLNLPKEINITLSSETENTLNALKTKEPIINERLKSASDELYDEYKKLETLKISDKREYTIDQIEQKQNEIGDNIAILENRINRQKKTGKFRGEENIEIGRGKDVVQGVKDGKFATNEQKAAEIPNEVKPIEELEKIPFEQRTSKEHSDFIKQKFEQEFTKQGNSKEQVQGALALLDARAKSWASETGNTPEDYYRRIADIKNGEFEATSQDVLNQFDALHGTIHDFDKFSTEKIGTGEGVQAFGWGLYFTDLENIARNYADKLSTRTVDKNRMLYKVSVHEGKTPDQYNYLDWDKPISDINKNKIKQGLKKILNEDINKLHEDFNYEYNKLKEKLDNINKSLNLGKGVNAVNFVIENGNKSKYYNDIVKQLSQNEINKLNNLHELYIKINKAKQLSSVDYNLNNLKAGDFYKFLAKNLGSDKAASLFLLENGIDGNKYPAESVSRGATSDNARGFNYVVFDENAITIKDKIKYQQEQGKPKGALETLQDGRKVIHAFDSADFSTMVHEITHIFEKDMTPDEVSTFEKHSNTKQGTTEFSESFARAGERYVRDGKAPTPELKPLFEKFKTWMKDIYSKLKGSPIENNIHPEVRKIFDRLLTEKPKENAVQEPTTTENVSRIGETGENITKNGEGMGQKVEGEKTTDTGKKETKIEDTLRKIADKVDSGKINKLGGFRTSTGFDAVWDSSLSVISGSLRAGASVAESIRSAVKNIKETDWYKGLKKNEKENFLENYWKHIYKELDVADERGSLDKLRDKLETISKVTKSDLKKFDSLVSDKDKLVSLKNRMKQIKAATDAITNIAYSLPLGDVAKKDLRRIKTIINDLQRKGNYTEIDFNNAVQEVKNISERIMNDAALTKLSTEVSALMTKQGRAERNRKSVITPEDKSYYSEMKTRLDEIKKQDKIANSNDPDSFKETEATKFETNLLNDILSTQNAIEEATSINEKKKLASQLNAMIDAYDIYNGDALSRMSKLESISDNIENSVQKRLEQVEKQNAWKKDVIEGILKNAKLGSSVDKGKIRQEQQGIGLQQEKKRNIFSRILQKSGFTRIIANQFMLYGMIENRGSRVEDGIAWEHFVNGDNGIVRRRSQYEALKTKRIEEETKIADKLGLGTKDFASRSTVKKKTGIERFVDGKYVEQQMSIDQAMLLYATSKNANSMARMDEMGWTEQSVSQAKEFLGKNGKKWAEYVDELMKLDESDGARYNKKHIEMFGFEMKVLENYAARKSQQMIGDGIMSEKGFNTIHLMPGALKNRVRNANIDFTDGFIDTRESSKHEMELWFHFGDWAKQHDIYFRDKDLYNHIMATNPEYLGMMRDNISSILGTGSVERQTLLLKASRNLAYGYLALNLNAAFKQGVGLVNWASKADIGNEIGLATDMVKISTTSLVKDWKWMKQNIPQFASRVQSSSIGLDGLMRMMEAGKSKSTIGNYANSAREWALKAGIKPNVVMDALTNVIGGKAYYNQQFNKYSKIMSSDKANQKAIDDVSRAINDINSSLYPEYMSPSQRSLVGKLSGTFANPSLTMLRAATKGAMDLRPIYNKAKSEYIKQGYSNKAASAKATMAIASKPGFESVRNYIIFSSVAPVLWNYMSNYQPLTDLDDEDKRNYVKAATLGYAYNIQFVGDVLKSMAEGRFSPELNNVGVKATEDYMKQIILDYKLNGEINEDVLKSVAKFAFVIGTGVQYDRLSDMVVGLYDAIKNTKDGDYEKAALDFAKFMSVPKYVRKEIIEKQFGNFEDYNSAEEYLSSVKDKISNAKDINGEPLRKKNNSGDYFNATEERNIKAYFRMYQHSESELMEFVEKYYGVPSDASSREIGKEASNIVKIVNLQNIAASKGLSLKGIMDSMEDYGFDFSDDFTGLADYIIENKLEGASVSTLKEKTAGIETKKKKISE